jgi:hypothetical protein
MAVRTSNVYEDSGVVIYEPDKDEEEPMNLPSGRGAGFTAYVGWHLKHQLAQGQRPGTCWVDVCGTNVVRRFVLADCGVDDIVCIRGELS